jgi:hypothetical protein
MSMTASRAPESARDRAALDLLSPLRARAQPSLLPEPADAKEPPDLGLTMLPSKPPALWCRRI